MANKPKRAKSDALLIPIPDWEEADQILRRIAVLQNDIAVAEMAAAEQIDAAKRRLQLDTADKHDAVKRYVKSLEAFCAARAETFAKRRSRTLQHGSLGWRKSTAITVKKTTLRRIREVFDRAAWTYLHVKETVNKDALAKLDDAALAAVDARRVHKETFFVEPDKVASVDHS